MTPGFFYESLSREAKHPRYSDHKIDCVLISHSSWKVWMSKPGSEKVVDTIVECASDHPPSAASVLSDLDGLLSCCDEPPKSD